MARGQRWLPAMALLMAGAAADSGEGVPQHQRDYPATSLDGPTSWQPCAFDVKNPSDLRAECASVNVPLDYADPGAGTFRVLVKRLKSTVEPTAHVWILAGGPGGSATANMQRLSFGIPEKRPDIVFYAVDHRGMGGSERLACARDESRGSDARSLWAACMDSLRKTVGVERLMQITMSNAARDIGTLAEKYREPGVKMIVMGNSYGTSLAHRYMQIFPQQPDGVVLHGIGAGGTSEGYGRAAHGSTPTWDQRMNTAVEHIFERCALAEDCARYFDRHPWDVARETMASLYRGHCAELGIEADRIKETLGAVSYATSIATLPALIRRLQRCNESDRALLKAAVDRWYPSITDFGKPGDASSEVAGNLISASGTFALQPLSVTELQRQFSEDLTIAYGVEKFYALMRDIWITHPHDEYAGKWADYRRPLLMLQGALDPATTLPQALAVRARYQGPLQTWALFPNGNHRLFNQTPAPDGTDCAGSLLIQFIEDPQAVVDKSCIGRVEPLNWHDGAAALRDFGVDDIWDGVPGSSARAQ